MTLEKQWDPICRVPQSSSNVIWIIKREIAPSAQLSHLELRNLELQSALAPDMSGRSTIQSTSIVDHWTTKSSLNWQLPPANPPSLVLSPAEL